MSATALAGALTGAVSAALMVLFEDPSRRDDPAALREAMRRATDIALKPWARS